jgi:hypothetical protein
MFDAVSGRAKNGPEISAAGKAVRCIEKYDKSRMPEIVHLRVRHAYARVIIFPDSDPPFYMGTQRVETAFMFAAKSSGMGSSVFRNVLEGNWVLSAMSDRLLQSPGLTSLE